jgi:hypothetical protein
MGCGHRAGGTAVLSTMSHFPELGTELVLLGSRHNADLMED